MALHDTIKDARISLSFRWINTSIELKTRFNGKTIIFHDELLPEICYVFAEDVLDLFLNILALLCDKSSNFSVTHSSELMVSLQPSSWKSSSNCTLKESNGEGREKILNRMQRTFFQNK